MFFHAYYYAYYFSNEPINLHVREYLMTTLSCRLLTRFDSNNGLHKEMLAVLAAVTEVIKEQGGKESTTEYFAALVSIIHINYEAAIMRSLFILDFLFPLYV